MSKDTVQIEETSREFAFGEKLHNLLIRKLAEKKAREAAADGK